MLAGYIDESYTGEKEPVTFGLNCVYTTYSDWFWIQAAWCRVLAQKNEALLAAGRRPIRRYHSNEISNFEGDFEGWTGDERTQLTKDLIAHALTGNFVQSMGFTANLKEVADVWPRVKFEGVKRFGYHAMLRLIMLNLENMIPEQFGRGACVILINEQCNYDAVMRDAFEHYLKARPEAQYIFSSIESKGWEECVPLQLADFLAYEVMKETNRDRPGQKQRQRRKSLSSLLELDHVGASSYEIPKEEILKWKFAVEEKDRKRGKQHLNDRFIDKA
jgi:hypothetical protein